MPRPIDNVPVPEKRLKFLEVCCHKDPTFFITAEGNKAIQELISSVWYWKNNHDQQVHVKRVNQQVTKEFARRLKEAGISREHNISTTRS